MKHIYTANDLVFNTCAAINDIDTPYIASDFKTLSEAFLGSKNPQLEPCREICKKTFEKPPMLAGNDLHNALDASLIEILVELFKIKPKIVLKKACGRSRQVLQKRGLV